MKNKNQESLYLINVKNDEPFISWEKKCFDEEFIKGKYIDIEPKIPMIGKKVNLRSLLNSLKKNSHYIKLNFEQKRKDFLTKLKNEENEACLIVEMEIKRIESIIILEKFGYKISKRKKSKPKI